MRTTIVLFLCLSLIGCESDFQKCMNTELPRAEELSGIEAELEAGRRLVAMRDFVNQMYDMDAGVKLWGKENPPPPGMPKYPAYSCSGFGAAYDECRSAHDKAVEIYKAGVDAWESTPDGRSWTNLRDQEVERLGLKTGFPTADDEKLERMQDEFYEVRTTLLESRSLIYQCYEDSDCDEYGLLESDYYDVLKKSFSEAIQNNLDTVSDLVEKSAELAMVTCNSNGLYE